MEISPKSSPYHNNIDQIQIEHFTDKSIGFGGDQIGKETGNV